MTFTGKKMKLCLILWLASFSAFSFEQVIFKNLELEYTSPLGTGSVSQIELGVLFPLGPHPISVKRSNDSFQFTSPFHDLTWQEPLQFLLDLDKLSIQNSFLELGNGKHFIKSDYLMFKLHSGDPFTARKMSGNCVGASMQFPLRVRLLDDCRQLMSLTVKEVEIPNNGALIQLMNQHLAQTPFKGDKLFSDQVSMKVSKGDLDISLNLKNFAYVTIRVLGYVQFEDEHQTIAIRVDKIRFGFFDVTKPVMDELYKMNTSSKVEIDPPWVRIKSQDIHEIGPN